MKKEFILFLVLIISSTFVSATPALYFSDLISGPNSGGQNNKGVFVTIVGKNFGATRDSSYVTVGGGQADNYPVWGERNAANPNLDMITFQLGPNAKTGEIVLHTSEGNSNPLPFTVRPGRVLFVDDDASAGGNGSFTNPWKSHVDFFNNIQTGDTCYFRQGTYSGINRWGMHYNVVSGNEKAYLNNEISWVGYPGETATFEALTPNVDEGNFGVSSYNVVASLRLKSSGRGCFGTWDAVGYRFVNNNCSGTTAFTYSLVGPSGKDGRILGNNLYDLKSGNKLSHPIYVGYGASNIDVGWNYIHDNDVDWGPIISIHRDYAILNDRKSNATGRAPFKLIDSTANFVDRSQNYHVGSTAEIINNGEEAKITAIDSTTQLSLDKDIFINGNEEYVINQYVFENNIVHDNVIDCSYRRSRAIGQVGTGRGSSVSIFNNIFIRCGGYLDWYLPFYFYSGSVNFYNNVIYQIADSAKYVIYIGAGGAYMPEKINIKNNIIVSNTAADYFSIDNEYLMQSLVIDKNLYTGHGVGPARDTYAVDADPLFVNPSANDFHLQSSSPAIDAGTNAVSSIVTKDFDGNTRPQGSAFDIGAYEYVTQAFHPADTNQNNKIEMKELIAFVGKWKSGQANLNDMIIALDRWFRGV